MSIYEKLAEVHAKIRQPVKDSRNPHFNSEFASLNECNRVVSEAIKEVGECDYWQRAVYNSDAQCWEMQVVFASGGSEMVLSSHPFRDSDNPQKSASASTYARRYALMSAFNMAAEDDDGNNASRDDTGAAKQRMWAALRRWAELHGRNPKEVLQGVQKRPEWAETSQFFNSVAEEFEGDING